ncbi:MAG: transglycosylase SLT domain-containing protein [Rikenellaceae bacterium]|jgi:membrane-bound lytic murein transglycosylase D|nr:transglycosylase SLT domain-containing protein [Rikenellaceae bacterium]
MTARKTIALTAALALFASLVLYAAPERYGNIQVKYTPEQYDSLLSAWYESSVVESYDLYLHDFIDIEAGNYSGPDSYELPDSVYEARLRMIASVIQLPYNDVVKRYILAYTGRIHSRMENILGLAQFYFPMIEEELDRQGLPLELKMLPVIESALYPKAISRSGATGLWQFILSTGKSFGLEINSFVDQRMDPATSTRAACLYLKQLYGMYGDWTLAIAAYNCGPGNINKALKRAPNAQTYWDIYDYLPKETRGYIPSFIAATYAYTFHKAHGIEPRTASLPFSIDTVTISKMTHFEQISSTLRTSMEVLRELNPQYKMDIVPATDKPYTLILPQYTIASFIEKEEEIYGKDSIYLSQYLNPANLKNNPAATALRGSSTYKVKSGDTLGAIAQRHGVSTAALTRANGIRNPRSLRIGQILVIP